jgi:hypothetical protein
LLEGEHPLSPVGRATRAQRRKAAAENPHENTNWLAAVKKEKVDLNTDTSHEEAGKRPLENQNLNSDFEDPAKEQRAKRPFETVHDNWNASSEESTKKQRAVEPYEEQANVHQQESEDELNSVDPCDQNDGDLELFRILQARDRYGRNGMNIEAWLGDESADTRKEIASITIGHLLRFAIITMEHRSLMELCLCDVIFAAHDFGFSGFEHVHDELFDVRKITGMHMSSLELALFFNSDYQNVPDEMLDHSSAAPCPNELGKIGREGITEELSRLKDKNIFEDLLECKESWQQDGRDFLIRQYGSLSQVYDDGTSDSEYDGDNEMLLNHLSWCEKDFQREKLDEYAEDLHGCLQLFSDMEASNTSTRFHIPEFTFDAEEFMTVTRNTLRSGIRVSRSAMNFLQILVETVVCGKVVCLPSTIKPRCPLADIMTPSICHFVLGNNGISLRIMACEIDTKQVENDLGEDDEDEDWKPDEEEEEAIVGASD